MEKDPNELIDRIENNEDLMENKYALIVVGRMGHGKSSFCKMVVDDSEKYKIQAHVSIRSGTLDCKIYVSNRFNDIFGQDILIIDTPGLDSKATVSLIAEDIDDLILKYKLKIAGIANVIDVMQREQDKQGGSYIFTLLDVLRVKYCYKINLTFCILSKYDRNYEYQDQYGDLMNQFSELFKKNSYGKAWERNIQWMSQPVKDEKAYRNKITTILKRQYNQQFPKLKEFLKIIVQNEQFLSYQVYEEDRRYFERLFKDSLIQDHDKCQYQKDISNFELTVEIEENLGIFKRVIGSALLAFGIQGTAISLEVGIGIIAEAIAIGSVGTMGIVLIPFAVGYGSYQIACSGAEILKDRFKGQIKPTMSEQKKQQILDQRIRQKLKGCLISAAIQQAKLDQNILAYKSLPYITKLQVFDKNNQVIAVNQIKKQQEVIYKARLKVGKNLIRFSYKMPTKQYYDKFLREKSRSFYNDKP